MLKSNQSKKRLDLGAGEGHTSVLKVILAQMLIDEQHDWHWSSRFATFSRSLLTVYVTCVRERNQWVHKITKKLSVVNS